jgi:hypothetical protein
VQYTPALLLLCFAHSIRHSPEFGMVAKGVRMDAFRDARSLGSVMTRMPNRFRIDRQITAVAVVAVKRATRWVFRASAANVREVLPVAWD